jgi:ribosomal protein S18 acetylase RimI-like enzyme
VSIEIRVLQPGDETVLTRVADDVFDAAIDEAAAASYVGDPRMHVAVAIDAGVVVGFASGVHYHHPDKPAPELFVNEVGVASTHHRRGLASAVLGALFEAARELGCVEAWVLTERDNPAAMRLYASVGGIEAPQDPVLYSFRLGG